MPSGTQAPKTTAVPTWLKVKTQIKSGSKGTDGFGPCDAAGVTPTLDLATVGIKHAPSQTPPPSWLKVKSQIKAGAKEMDRGTDSNDAPSPALSDLFRRVR